MYTYLSLLTIHISKDLKANLHKTEEKKKPTTRKMCTWNLPMHGTKALQNTCARRSPPQKQQGQQKQWKKKGGVSREAQEQQSRVHDYHD